MVSIAKTWLTEQVEDPKVLPVSGFKAVDYALKRFKYFERSLDGGRVVIDNNRAENQIRPIALGRKNYLFASAKNTQDKAENRDFSFFIRSQKVERINSYSFDGEGVLTAGDGVGTGKIFHHINGKFDFHQKST